MKEIKLIKRYPHSRTEDIVDAYMRGWNDALDAVQNGKFHIAERNETESECNTCKYAEDADEHCELCGIADINNYEPKADRKTEPQTDKGVSYSDHTDYREPKTYVTWTEPQTDCAWK